MDKNKSINAIIVDDEKGCITNLQYHLSKCCPYINIIATGTNLQEAFDKTEQKKIDLAFLDIEIFDDNIFNSLGKLDNPGFKIVFVTAYQQYALKAIKIEALDYILKPLSEDDILDCSAKIRKHFLLPQNLAVENDSELPEEKKNKKIIIKNSDKIYIIKIEDIYYMSGSGFYTEITFDFNNQVKTIMLSKPLNKVEEEYAHDLFYRVHKSHIINTGKISNIINNNGVSIKMKNAMIIPVAKRRATIFLSFLNNVN